MPPSLPPSPGVTEPGPRRCRACMPNAPPPISRPISRLPQSSPPSPIKRPPEETAMKLTEQQIAEFHDLGYLIIPDCFSPEEVALLRDEAESVYRLDRQDVWRGTSGDPPPPLQPAE